MLVLFSSAAHFILNQKSFKRHYFFELQNVWLYLFLFSQKPMYLKAFLLYKNLKMNKVSHLNTVVRKLLFQFTIDFNPLCLAMPVDIWDTGESVANAACWIKKDGSQSLPPGLSKCYRKQTQFPTLWGANYQTNKQTQMSEQWVTNTLWESTEI